jgi:hypothetical protein
MVQGVKAPVKSQECNPKDGPMTATSTETRSVAKFLESLDQVVGRLD